MDDVPGDDGEKWAFAGARCPFDALEFQRGDHIVVCPECATPHHHDCWSAQDGCTQFGCTARGVAALEATAPLRDELVVMVHEDQRVPCAFCGEPILAIARKCKHCNEYLDPSLRRERALYMAGLRVELPMGANFLSLSQTITGFFGALSGFVAVVTAPSPATVCVFLMATALMSLGLGLNAGREWARRINQTLVGASTLFGALVTILNVLWGHFEALFPLLLFTAIPALLFASVSSEQCRRYCRRLEE